jgi:hypothetical protein
LLNGIKLIMLSRNGAIRSMHDCFFFSHDEVAMSIFKITKHLHDIKEKPLVGST